jgi:hypothetical protein
MNFEDILVYYVTSTIVSLVTFLVVMLQAQQMAGRVESQQQGTVLSCNLTEH